MTPEPIWEILSDPAVSAHLQPELQIPMSSTNLDKLASWCNNLKALGTQEGKQEWLLAYPVNAWWKALKRNACGSDNTDMSKMNEDRISKICKEKEETDEVAARQATRYHPGYSARNQIYQLRE